MLVIDSREPTINGIRTLFETEKVPVRVETMAFGDYKLDFGDRVVLVERKTPSDFLNSSSPTVKNPESRLAVQLKGCLNTGAKVILLIDDTYYPLKGGRMQAGRVKIAYPFASFVSRLRSVHGIGVRVEWNPAPWYLPQYLLNLYRYESKDTHTSLDLAPKSFTTREKWGVLLAIRGVGPATAKALFSEFGSISNIAQSEPESLCKVKGVGPKIAESIQWYLN